MSNIANDLVLKNIAHMKDRLKNVDFTGCPANGFARDFYALGLDVYEAILTQTEKVNPLKGTVFAGFWGIAPTVLLLTMYWISKREGWL